MSTTPFLLSKNTAEVQEPTHVYLRIICNFPTGDAGRARVDIAGAVSSNTILNVIDWNRTRVFCDGKSWRTAWIISKWRLTALGDSRLWWFISMRLLEDCGVDLKY
jgi:hypothetical protein